jgi:hypothetical protein
MRPPPRYSASPLPSWATIPTQPSPSFPETAKAIWRWLRGVQPDWRQRSKEARLIEALAAEMDEDEVAESAPVPKPKGKRR